jgi:hypothetical protein
MHIKRPDNIPKATFNKRVIMIELRRPKATLLAAIMITSMAYQKTNSIRE